MAFSSCGMFGVPGQFVLVRCRPDSCSKEAANLRAMIDIDDSVPQLPQEVAESFRCGQRVCLVCFGEKGPQDCSLVPCQHICVCSKDAEMLIESQSLCNQLSWDKVMILIVPGNVY